jgi:predicted metal-dependent hydrolase
MPDSMTMSEPEALSLAQELIDADRPFHAHEVLEAIWKSGVARDPDLWRGLAQIAVGLTHARRGNERGAAILLRRGADAVAVAAPGSSRAARDLADRIERSGLDSLPADALRIQLGPVRATDIPASTRQSPGTARP